jgi:hypothetical protein
MSPPYQIAMSTMDPTLHAGTQLRTIPYLAQQSFAIRYSRYAHDDFFARSVWPSTNHSLLGSKEPTLLCNHVVFIRFHFSSNGVYQAL